MKLSKYLKVGMKMKIIRKENGISQKMMAELLKLKEELGANNGENSSHADT